MICEGVMFMNKAIIDRLKAIDKKIMNKEDNVRGGFYMFGVGIAGIMYGVLSKSDSSIISGMAVSSGSLIFRAINNISLNRLRLEQSTYRYILMNNSNDEYSKKDGCGKHFKK